MKKETRLLYAGRDPEANFGIVNPPVYHASTVTFPTLAELEKSNASPFTGVNYGRMGTPTTFAFEDAVAELEGAEKCIAMPSGLAAISATLLAFLDTGDHLLITDNAYHPSHRVCEDVLARLGVRLPWNH